MRLPNREACTGCGSCAAVCPKGCIQMTADDEGFFYPQIDQDQCVDCKKCESACAVLHPPKVGDTAQIHAAQNMDSAIRQESSSGGVFTALAELFIRQGGAVCAAVYNEDFSVPNYPRFPRVIPGDGKIQNVAMGVKAKVVRKGRSLDCRESKAYSVKVNNLKPTL